MKFGPHSQWECVAGKKQETGQPFFVVPTRHSLQFEMHVQNLLKGKEASLKKLDISYPSGKNNFYIINKH